MLRLASALTGYKIEATDGAIGTVADFLFDDRTWKLRWMVVDTGTWLSGRTVLLHPSSIGRPDDEQKQLPVVLNRAQVEGSPDIAADQPVSRQMESALYGYYGWNPLWGASCFGGSGIASPLAAPAYFGANVVQEAATLDTVPEADQDPHLRSIAAVTSYHIHAADGTIGHLEDILVEDSDWLVRYLVVDTSDWWLGKHVLVSPYAVRGISLADREVRLDVDRAKVRGSPPWAPFDPINRDYQSWLHSYYGWPDYLPTDGADALRARLWS